MAQKIKKTAMCLLHGCIIFFSFIIVHYHFVHLDVSASENIKEINNYRFSTNKCFSEINDQSFSEMLEILSKDEYTDVSYFLKNCNIKDYNAIEEEPIEKEGKNINGETEMTSLMTESEVKEHRGEEENKFTYSETYSNENTSLGTTLIGAVLLIRHGTRTPVGQLSRRRFYYGALWPYNVEPGKLTSKGETEMRDMGKSMQLIYSKYIDYLSLVHEQNLSKIKEKIYIQATSVDRVIKSAEAFLYGFLTPYGDGVLQGVTEGNTNNFIKELNTKLINIIECSYNDYILRAFKSKKKLTKITQKSNIWMKASLVAGKYLKYLNASIPWNCNYKDNQYTHNKSKIHKSKSSKFSQKSLIKRIRCFIKLYKFVQIAIDNSVYTPLKQFFTPEWLRIGKQVNQMITREIFSYGETKELSELKGWMNGGSLLIDIALRLNALAFTHKQKALGKESKLIADLIKAFPPLTMYFAHAETQLSLQSAFGILYDDLIIPKFAESYAINLYVRKNKDESQKDLQYEYFFNFVINQEKNLRLPHIKSRGEKLVEKLSSDDQIELYNENEAMFKHCFDLADLTNVVNIKLKKFGHPRMLLEKIESHKEKINVSS